ncbi:MAG: CocE/NonD family hydrolase C-terminal non-catalytic domain-containing protein [Acidobacteriota bacterium]|nr:CocE/NonD family hydrolase C-terminal non-catalytic domain-containing protein [Acidobacteriota bacterium]
MQSLRVSARVGHVRPTATGCFLLALGVLPAVGIAAAKDSSRSQILEQMVRMCDSVRLDIDLWKTAIVVGPGHRLALDVTSSNRPRFEVNPNTGESPGESKLPPRVARNTIHHASSRPSAVILPILPE